MTDQELSRRVQAAVAKSEVMAVVAAMRSGNRPIVGEVLEHYLDGNATNPHSRPLRYHFPVELWHLREAERVFSQKT